MALECIKCNKKIQRRDCLSCFQCSHNYHIDCANVSMKRFLLMSSKNKANWKCDECYSKTQKNPTQNNLIINVTTNNSYDILSDDDNSDLLTTFSQNSRSNSCPDMRKLNMEDKIEKLKDQNKELKEKLQIAELEIENILLENSKLKRALSRHEMKTKILADICNSSSKKNITTRKNQKTSNISVLDFMNDEKDDCSNHSLLQITSTPSRPKAKRRLASNTGSSTPYQQIDKNPQELSLDGSAKEITTRNPIIHIIGDQQVRGLAAKLRSSRSGLFNDCYSVFGMVKPYALTSDVLRSCEDIQDSLNSNDILILSVGCNDKNPYLILSNICNILCKLKKCKIFLLSVQHNSFLNVHKLNSEINLILKNYKNCNFIDINKLLFYDQSTRNMTSNIITKICNKLNIEIDYIKYEHYFIKNGLKSNIMYLNDCFRNQNLPKSRSSKVGTNMLSKYKKGTIPYYFPPTAKLIPNKNISSSENKTPDFFRP